MRRLSRALFAAILVSFGGDATAGEFGNVFGNDETQKASRDASATALAGIEKAIAGLRDRELQSGSGAEQFLAASKLFSEAADKMEAILKTFPDQELSEPQIVFLKAQFTPGSEMLADLQNVKSFQDVYRSFAAKTREMSGTMEGLASRENAFAVLAPLLIEYFQLADAIVAVRAVK